ncbi:MAG: radical SAM protein [Candidatus Scalindua sediminis]|nr:radical SAM protein [Candidatus Scalindua sediminis]
MEPRFRRVLLTTPPVLADQGALRPNMGLGYIAQVLKNNNIQYDVLDMMIGYSLDDLKAKIDTFKPDILGMNIFSNKYKTAYKTLEDVKRYYPSIPIIVGGPHVSCIKKQVLEGCSAIDYAVVREGEETVLELCNGEDLKKIKGLYYREGDGICFNGFRESNNDLDTIPFPTFSKFEIDKYLDERALSSSRGCPYSCVYCAVGTAIGKKMRVRSAENVVDEIEYWYKHGCRQFSFQDDNFNFYKERVLKICDELARRGLDNLFLRCAGARADKLDVNVLTRMKNVGFKTIAIGVEVGNDKMLKAIKKGEKFEDIDKAVKTACDLGYDVYLNFLVGSPQETLEDLKDTARFALKYPVFHADFSNIIPYPGTELYDWLEKNNYLLEKPEVYLNDNSTYSNVPVFETPELPVETRKKQLIYFKGVRKKILRRAFVRTLNARGIPWGLSHFIGYVTSLDLVSKYLFHPKVRKLADKIRFDFYMKQPDRCA